MIDFIASFGESILVESFTRSSVIDGNIVAGASGLKSINVLIEDTTGRQVVNLTDSQRQRGAKWIASIEELHCSSDRQSKALVPIIGNGKVVYQDGKQLYKKLGEVDIGTAADIIHFEGSRWEVISVKKSKHVMPHFESIIVRIEE